MDNQKTHYGWIELAALLPDGRMVRGQFLHADDFEAINKWRNRFKNRDIFFSICLYAEPNSESQFISPMFFDIDCPENLHVAKENALFLCQMLMDRAFVPQDCLDIHFSGNKGFHITVPCQVFDAFYSPHILELYKRMARKAQAQGIHSLDSGVYTKKRIWRLPNSINSKSGLFKIPLAYEELRDMDIAGILELAKTVRPENSFVTPRIFEMTSKWYQEAIKRCETPQSKPSSANTLNRNFKKGWRIPPCIKAIEVATLPDGIRHQLYLDLARYYSFLNMHHDEIIERLEAIDQRHPVRDPGCIARAAKFGCEHPGFPGCSNPVLQRYCRKENCFYAKLKTTK